MLPLHMQPTFATREGGVGGNFVGPSWQSPHGATFYLDDFLCIARNGISSAGGPWPVIPAPEYPAPPFQAKRASDAKNIPDDFKEGFEGHPHNLQSVIPDRILQQHSEWCGMTDDGKRLPPSKGGPMFCMTNPEVIRYVADKMVYWSGDNPNSDAEFRMVPLDGTSFCHCPRCRALYEPLERPKAPYVAGPVVISDPYFYFISQVAKLVKVQRPKVTILALAYADYTTPPRHLAQLPDNVQLQVCLYGARNLPVSSSPENAEVRQYLQQWATLTPRPMLFWDYLLIHSEWRTLTMPIPMVTAIADRERYLAHLGMTGGLTQADFGSSVHNPWNHYAHMRSLWDAQLGANKILGEFFPAYYHEASQPMLAYYKTLEDYLIAHNVSLQDFGYDEGPNPQMLTPQLITTLQGHLAQAAKLAKSWYVQQRVQTAQADLDWLIPAAQRRSMDPAVALRYGKQVYRCPRRRGAITLDGKLDDAGWQGVPVAADFRIPMTQAPAAATEATEFRMTWDDEKLYMAIKCVNPDVAKLQPNPNVWGMDHLEFFLVPGHEYNSDYFQSAMSAMGATWGPKRFLGTPWAIDPQPATPYEMAITRGDGYWVCEMAIPFATLNTGAPKVGDCWRMNLVRSNKSWSALPIAMWHLYHDFNLITFTGEGAQ